jgi:decaprenyl-phosphate phosphoribosyltransferase
MLGGLLRTMRPHQWVKNLFVLAPVVFAQELFELEPVLGALAGFLLFSLLASSIYILNDLVDVEADRAHPVKRHRPIASGVLPVAAAKVAFGLIAVTALGLGLLLNPLFAAATLAYFVNNLFYSFGLKRVAYVDVLSIATGFELRVVAGSLAARVEPSTYLLVVTFILALYLGLGKRMHELVQAEASGSARTRAVLRQYNRRAVDALLWVTSTATVVTYVFYTLDAHTRYAFGTDYLAISGVFTIFGVLRFMQLVRNRPHAESPTEEMLRDWPFLVNLALWGLAVVMIIYIG